MTEQLPDPIAAKVHQAADRISATEADLTAAVTETYESLPDSLPHETRWDVAFKRGKKSLIDANSMGNSAGEVASVITIGHDRVSQWPNRNHPDYEEGMSKDAMPRKDVLITSGVVRREESGKTAVASIIFDSTDGVDLGAAMEMFSQPFNVFSGRFNFAEPNTASTGFILYSTSSTEIEPVDDPMAVEDRQRLVANAVDDVTIADLASNPRAHLSLSDGNGAADFGIDLKRISGATIYDHWINDEGDRGVYTILDDSVIGPADLEGSQLDGENQRIAGLSAWSHANLMQYDDDSVCDFYGVLREDYNGQISMDVRGIDPVFAEQLTTAEGVGSQSAETF